MTRQHPPSHFTAATVVRIADGLDPAIDAVAGRAPDGQAFLRHAWFAAAVDAYHSRAVRTVVVEERGAPVITMPLVALGPPALRLAAVPGPYWPYRAFPVVADTSYDAVMALLRALRTRVAGWRLGPVHADDLLVERLRRLAPEAGWRVVERRLASRFVLDIDAARAAEPWPRNSTLRKNRFHEKHLAAHGALGWRFLTGADWSPALFAALADIERASWIADRTDGADAKFASPTHGAFWRAAAADPVISKAMRAAMLTIDGKPAAFSFDLAAGPVAHAIANSYDAAYAKHSPGKLLYYRNLVRAADEGTHLVDWGAGDSGYKRVIGAVEAAPIVDLMFVRPSLGAIARGLWGRS